MKKKQPNELQKQIMFLQQLVKDLEETKKNNLETIIKLRDTINQTGLFVNDLDNKVRIAESENKIFSEIALNLSKFVKNSNSTSNFEDA